MNFHEISGFGAKLLEVLGDLVLGIPLGFRVFDVSPGVPRENLEISSKSRFSTPLEGSFTKKPQTNAKSSILVV
jgi:hypothetical protein